jgi:hypothetical protein
LTFLIAYSKAKLKSNGDNADASLNLSKESKKIKRKYKKKQ